MRCTSRVLSACRRLQQTTPLRSFATLSRIATAFVFAGAMLLAADNLPAETSIVLEDCEAMSHPWSGTEVVSEPVHEGKYALRWDVVAAPGLNSPMYFSDWTQFDELRFWAYLPEPVDFRIPLIFASEGGYYLIDWQLNWSGWKEHRFKLADCRPSHEPRGWDTIRSIGFRPQGYGQGPVPAGLAIVFDNFVLHSPKKLPVSSLAELTALERKKQIAELKAKGNPYFESVYETLRQVQVDPHLPDEVPSSWSYSGITTRALASAWGASYDKSPLKGNETLIAHAVKSIDFCLAKQKDGSWFYSRKWPDRSDPNSDRFALGPLMDAIYWLRRLPNTEQHWKQWEAPLRELIDFQYKNWGHYKDQNLTNNIAWGGGAYSYPNQDVFHLYEMALAHKFWGDRRYQADVQATLDGLEAHLLPGGGLNYIGPETEIPTYHDLNVVWIARYYALTGDERAKKLLQATRDYYPSVCSNEGRPEYYTDCWWKHYWGDGKAAGPEIIAGITGSPHNKWLANRLLERTGTGSTYFAIYAGMFYKADVAEQPLPDDWLYHDKNIGGPRGRLGDWYYAGVTGGGARDTFVGAMICDNTVGQPLKGALMAATLEVGQPPDDRGRNRDLYISGSDDVTDSQIVGKTAVLGTRYTIHRPYINSVTGKEVPPTPWQGTQVWLLTQHGLVGLLQIEATEQQTVPHLGGEVRLGPKLPVQQTDERSYRVGPLTARILQTSFPQVTAGKARPPYAQTESQHEAILLRTNGTEYTAKPGEPLHFVVLIAPQKSADQFQDFQLLKADGVEGFEVNVAGKRMIVFFDPAKGSIRLKTF